MQDVMQQIVDYSKETVAGYEGVLRAHDADGFVALFGVDTAHEDDGRRAVLAALAIERRALQLGVSLRIGVGAGLLVVTRVGGIQPSSYSVVGETLRAADLLQQFAAPGSILIDETIYRGIDRHIAAEETPSAPPGIRAFRVIGMLGAAGSVWPQRRTLVPFVGRDQETAILRSLGDRAGAGHGQVVSVIGEPGMGKSRLAYEFVQALRQSGCEFDVIEGRCVSYGSRIPYLPVVDLIRGRCGINDADPPDVIREALDRGANGRALSPECVGLLLRLLGIVDDSAKTASPDVIKEKTFDALRRLLLRPAQCPLVIVVEDLHWIDRTSEEFLMTLVERVGGAHVLLLATHRPGYCAPWLDRAYVTQIALSPLDAAASAQLVESIALSASVGSDVSSAILRRGEGNPFFLEELARSVAERGTGSRTIPDTVQGVIMARLDRLPADAKQLLQCAAVLGREAPMRELARVPCAANLDASLRDLCRQDFLYERIEGDETVFVFKHALTQDVAYDSLLSRRRRELHLEAARMLEDLYRDRLDEITERLAHHYVRTDLVLETVTWLVRAADRAARVYANAEAILHLELAARRVQRLAEGEDRDRLTIDVALRHAQSLYFLGRFRESVDVLLPHEARVSRLNDDRTGGAYAFWLAHM